MNYVNIVVMVLMNGEVSLIVLILARKSILQHMPRRSRPRNHKLKVSKSDKTLLTKPSFRK